MSCIKFQSASSRQCEIGCSWLL